MERIRGAFVQRGAHRWQAPLLLGAAHRPNRTPDDASCGREATTSRVTHILLLENMIYKLATALALLAPTDALLVQPAAVVRTPTVARASMPFMQTDGEEPATAPASQPIQSMDSAPFGAVTKTPAAGAVSGWDIKSISPDGSLTQRVEGMTRKTWNFNDISKDRVSVAVTSEGRPVNADIQLWIGPDWTPMKMSVYSEDGKLRPIQTLVGTRNKEAMIEVRNVGQYEFPFSAASNYATGAMATLPQDIPASTEGERVDGGAIRSYPIDGSVEKLEVVLCTDGRQLNARVEILNAPNNPKQTYEIFTNNGQLNSLALAFNCVDPGNTVRIINLAPVEFPCYIHLKEN